MFGLLAFFYKMLILSYLNGNGKFLKISRWMLYSFDASWSFKNRSRKSKSPEIENAWPDTWPLQVTCMSPSLDVGMWEKAVKTLCWVSHEWKRHPRNWVGNSSEKWRHADVALPQWHYAFIGPPCCGSERPCDSARQLKARERGSGAAGVINGAIHGLKTLKATDLTGSCWNPNTRLLHWKCNACFVINYKRQLSALYISCCYSRLFESIKTSLLLEVICLFSSFGKNSTGAAASTTPSTTGSPRPVKAKCNTKKANMHEEVPVLQSA